MWNTRINILLMHSVHDTFYCERNFSSETPPDIDEKFDGKFISSYPELLHIKILEIELFLNWNIRNISFKIYQIFNNNFSLIQPFFIPQKNFFYSQENNFKKKFLKKILEFFFGFRKLFCSDSQLELWMKMSVSSAYIWRRSDIFFISRICRIFWWRHWNCFFPSHFSLCWLLHVFVLVAHIFIESRRIHRCNEKLHIHTFMSRWAEEMGNEKHTKISERKKV